MGLSLSKAGRHLEECLFVEGTVYVPTVTMMLIIALQDSQVRLALS